MIPSERKRRRPAVSCTLCRRRKIRCNRETPCSNCIRSKTSSCVYETDAPDPPSNPAHFTQPQPRHVGPKVPTATTSTSSAAPFGPGYASISLATNPSSSHSSFELDAMKARIAELEEKLSQSTSTTPSVYSGAASSAAQTYAVQTITSFAGTIDVLQDNRTFGCAHAISRGIAHKNRVFGQSHWMNGFIVFRDIIELMEQNLRSGSSTIVANIHRSKALGRVIKSRRSPTWPTLPTRDLPPKHICDKLVDNYLRTMETIYRVLHIPTFRREYEAMWVNDTDPSLPFVIQVKLVLALGATIGDEMFSMRTEAIRWIFEAQTWLSSPVIKSRLGIPYLQTSILALLARGFVDVGSELVWVSLGTVIRAAVYIGLHKDPTRLPRITFFNSEMRRRIWNTILELSLQSSLESGGPCFISLEDFETEPPGNFDDEQLTSANPIAQSEDVHTHTSGVVALRRTFPARLAVTKFLNDINSSGTYEETLQIDAEMRATYRTVRRTLQSYTLKPDSLLSQFQFQAIEFIMQRYISSLHLPFFGPSLQDPVYAFSRKAVIDSSLKIWNLACPNQAIRASNIPQSFTIDGHLTSNESDLARLCRCGSGFFRTFAFHASTFLGVEARAQLQEDDDHLNTMSFQPKLFAAIYDAADWYLGCMEAGETGVKGYLLLSLLAAQVDATKRRITREEMSGLLVSAAEEAAETCLPLLESMAGQVQGGGVPDPVDGFDFEISPEFMEDWDTVMSDMFNIGDAESIDSFLA